jgi:putative transcriptional regulator
VTQGLHPGDFLVADPRLTDPNFESSVVLICEHNDEGTLGLIVNRPIEEAVELLFDEKDFDQDLQVFWGGPVTQQGLHALHQGKPGQELSDATEVMPGLYFGGCMEDLVEAQKAGESVRFFFGYAGWEPGQLRGELDDGAWHVLPAEPPQALTEKSRQLWSDLMSKTDPSLAWMRHIPDDPSLN